MRKFTAILVLAACSLAHAETREEYRRFLTNLGFEDYSAQIRANLAAGTGAGTVGEKVLQLNEARYDVVNQARELAVEIIGNLVDRGTKPEEVARVIDFAARMMAFQPLEPPSEFPEGIRSLPPERQAQAKVEHLVAVTEKQMRLHMGAVASDLVNAMFGAKTVQDIVDGAAAHRAPTPGEQATLKTISDAQVRAAKLVAFSYLDGEMGQTRYLGRALAACLMKLAKNDPGIAVHLDRAVRLRGQRLENFVGDKVVFTDAKGKDQRITLQNGDFIMERSREQEAGQIGFAARPAPENFFRAFRHKLLGGPLAMVLPVEDFNNGNLTLSQWLRNRAVEYGPFNSGFSHVGVATVLEDPATGIRMTWGLDNYPNSGWGGIRLLGIPENFAQPGPFMRFGVARYKPEKFWDYAQEQIKRTGYRPYVWPAEKDYVTDDFKAKDVDNPERADWPITISKGEFEKLHDVPREKAAEWYGEVMRRMTDHIRHRMLTRDGIGFAYNFVNRYGRTYCSQTVVIAALQSTGLELQKALDQWNLLVKGLDKFNTPVTENLDVNFRIVAPSGFIWQEGLVDFKSSRIVDYPFMSHIEQLKAMTEPEYLETDPVLTENLAALRKLKYVEDPVVSVKGGAKDLAERVEDEMLREIRKRAKSTHLKRRAGHQRGNGPLAFCARLIENLDFPRREQ
jgi:hypothetical protein